MILLSRARVLALVALVVLAGASSAAAADTYVERGLRGAGTQHVIITSSPGRQNEVVDTLRKHGNAVRSQHPSINGVAADIDGADVADLATHGAITITQDHKVNVHSTINPTDIVAPVEFSTSIGPTVGTLRVSLGLSVGRALNLVPSTSGATANGTGVVVAIIDSGIGAEYAQGGEKGAEFADAKGASRIVGWKDYTVNASGQPYDDFGHGTHVAGLIASSGALSNYRFQGVAPNAGLVILKVLGADGSCSESTVIHAIEDAVNVWHVKVINLSLGHPITAPARFDPLVQAVEYASSKGVAVVIAAGNDGAGYASVNSPGNAPSAITTGAADGKATLTRADDYVPSFSSRGPTWYDGLAKPDVVAPGVNLYSDAAAGSTLVASVTGTSTTYPQELVGSATLLDLSGTSMAAAVTTGVVALELDANSHQSKAPLTPNAAKAILEYTAISLADTDALTQGAGQINGAGATQLAGSINTGVPMRSWWLQSGVSGSSVIGGQTQNWAQNIIWGTTVLTGRFMYYKNPMWSNVITWGMGVLDGRSLLGSKRIRFNGKFIDDNIIWGTDFTVKRKNIVFGNDDGDNIIWGTDDGDNIIWGTHLTQFRVVGQRSGNKVLWATDDADNIIWGTMDDDNIIWGTDDGDNIIWGTWAGDGDNIIWGTTADDNIIWGTSAAEDNIIWGTSGKLSKVVHGKDGDNIIWGTNDSDNIIWGTAHGDNIIWGTADDNIIWGTDNGDNIIWGTSGKGRH